MGHLYGSSIQTQIVMIVMIVMKVIKKKKVVVRLSIVI